MGDKVIISINECEPGMKIAETIFKSKQYFKTCS